MAKLKSKVLLRAVIVGCGRIAGIKDHPKPEGCVDTHAQAYYRHPAFELVGACDIDAVRLAAFQHQWGIPYGFTTVDELMRHTMPDVISVCSPTPEHFRHVVSLLQQPRLPRVVFVEKPVCEISDELNVMEQLAIERNVAVLVNHTRRFDPSYRKVAHLIQNRLLGELVQGRCDYYGGWLNNGPHVVDTLRMLIGEELTVVAVTPGAPGRPGDPCWNVQLRFGDVPVIVESFDESFYQLSEMDLRFEGGRILFRDFGTEIIVEKVEINNLDECVLTPLLDSPWIGLNSPMYHVMSAVADYLHDGVTLADTGATLDSVRRTMTIVWRVLEQAGKGKEKYVQG